MDKNIPLSALIRIGSKQHPKCRGALAFWQSIDKHDAETCAIGAAYVAKTGELPTTQHATMDTLRTCGTDPGTLVDLPNGARFQLSSAIAYLNDNLDWSRERIADWLESIGL